MILKMSYNAFIANSKKQSLAEHSFLIGELAAHILGICYPKSEFFDKQNKKLENLQKIARITGLFHDLGKIDPNFQHFLSKAVKETTAPLEEGVQIEDTKKFSFEDYPRHEELSFALFKSYINTEKVSYFLEEVIWKVLLKVFYREIHLFRLSTPTSYNKSWALTEKLGSNVAMCSCQVAQMVISSSMGRYTCLPGEQVLKK